jgi:NADH:ubiquinone oxidoreductase subunit 5 (subunit L)/multisubunit Na+/H+ antiporter MnhA subunit
MGFLGIIQNDIKRVVAYSTLSQLGYMTVALGASAYSVAVFHLMTHAFFKALLFLAAGSVIMGVHHNQDIRWMGGLRKYMPITWITSLLGSLALIGTPLFAGFYSKDSIIEAVHFSHLPAPVSPLCGAGRRVRHGVLFVPHVLPGVPWQGALRPEPGRAPRRTMTTATGMTIMGTMARTSRPGW